MTLGSVADAGPWAPVEAKHVLYFTHIGSSIQHHQQSIRSSIVKSFCHFAGDTGTTICALQHITTSTTTTHDVVEGCWDCCACDECGVQIVSLEQLRIQPCECWHTPSYKQLAAACEKTHLAACYKTPLHPLLIHGCTQKCAQGLSASMHHSSTCH